MNKDRQSRKAKEFLALHGSDELLVLLNAWDVSSARVFEAAGSKAIGTTSMGIAAARGYPDGERIPLEEMLADVGRIVSAIELPVSADLETGYGSTVDGVVASVRRATRCGIVGINLEDGTGLADRPLMEARELADRVGAIREASNDDGLHLVINARTDLFLQGPDPEKDRLAEAVRRGNRYREAGADCIFVPGAFEPETIRRLVEEIDAPVNILANPAISKGAVPTIAELQQLGVARVSVGSGPMRASLELVMRIATEILESGSYDAMADELGRPGTPRAYRAATRTND